MNTMPQPRMTEGQAEKARQQRAEKMYGCRNTPLAPTYHLADFIAEFPEARREWRAILRENNIPLSHPAYDEPARDNPETERQYKAWVKEKMDARKKALEEGKRLKRR